MDGDTAAGDVVCEELCLALVALEDGGVGAGGVEVGGVLREGFLHKVVGDRLGAELGESVEGDRVTTGDSVWALTLCTV